MKNILLNPRVQLAVDIVVSLFGLFMLYQILRRMFGGSWGIETLIFGLVVLHIGFTFWLAMKMTETKTEVRHLRSQFHSLATDFKELRSEVSNQKIEFKAQRNEFTDLRNEFTKLGHKVEVSLKKRK
ncbi:MAG: hypothetical protein Q8L34_00560 [Candidatus Woesearchaeota archaeon]|nr:hypothetical protein [Candidatus Woesearchaeota archaeon]